MTSTITVFLISFVAALGTFKAMGAAQQMAWRRIKRDRK